MNAPHRAVVNLNARDTKIAVAAWKRDGGAGGLSGLLRNLVSSYVKRATPPRKK